jgi:hypothetical protein
MLERMLRDSNVLYASIAQAYHSETAGEDNAVVRGGGVDSVHLV